VAKKPHDTHCILFVVVRSYFMKHFENYERIIAHSERSAGNESVGDMWVETKSFDKQTPVSEIIEWGKSTGGKLHLTIDEGTVKEGKLSF
jgi:hypothetical protein